MISLAVLTQYEPVWDRRADGGTDGQTDGQICYINIQGCRGYGYPWIYPCVISDLGHPVDISMDIYM